MNRLANDASSCLTFNKAHCESNQKLHGTWSSVEVSDYARNTKDTPAFPTPASFACTQPLLSSVHLRHISLRYLCERVKILPNFSRLSCHLQKKKIIAKNNRNDLKENTSDYDFLRAEGRIYNSTIRKPWKDASITCSFPMRRRMQPDISANV